MLTLTNIIPKRFHKWETFLAKSHNQSGKTTRAMTCPDSAHGATLVESLVFLSMFGDLESNMAPRSTKLGTMNSRIWQHFGRATKEILHVGHMPDVIWFKNCNTFEALKKKKKVVCMFFFEHIKM